MLTEVLPQILFLLGIGFFVANGRAAVELGRWFHRRRSALLVWPARKPPYYGLCLGIGLMMGLLLLLKAYMRPPAGSDLVAAWEFAKLYARQQFGELMMFVYYGYAIPLSTRIARGLYADGIWADSGFLAYSQIGGLTWKGEDSRTLVLISRRQNVARTLEVPGPALGEVRRLLREKIASGAIEFDGGPGLHLGERDVRDSV
ncbi:MAG: hypothetical protein LC791_08120 [Acidobacteria bacterium]|nr:hypothetical protein [Acidobacteriota bacterium]